MNNANDGSFGTGLNLSSLIIFYLAILVSYSYLFYISIKNKILSFNKRSTIILTIAVVSFIYLMLVSLLTNYENFGVMNGNSITPMNKIVSIMDSSIMCLFIFTIFTCIPNLKEKDLMMRFFSFGLLLFAFSAIIYSLANEIEVYKTMLFSGGFITKSNDYAYSFFEYGNVYGHLLFFGFLCILYLGYSYSKRWIYLIGIAFGFLIVFSGCRAGFICYLFTNIILLIYFIYWLWHKNKIASISVATLFLGTLIWLILEVFVIRSIIIPYKIEIDENLDTIIYDDLHYIIEVLENDFFTERDVIFKELISNINITQLIFGLGIDNLDYLIRFQQNSAFNLHNGFYTIYFTGGIYFTLIYLLIFVITILKLFKVVKFDKRFFLLYLGIFISAIIYQFSESYPAMFPVFGGGVMGMILITSVNLKYKESKDFEDICVFI